MGYEIPAAELFYLVALMLLIGAGVWRAYIARPSVAFSHIFIWAGIFTICFIAVALFNNPEKLSQSLLGGLIPSKAMVNEQGEVILHKTQDGHFYIDAKVEDIAVKFMVDTGASRVVLNPDDARRMGMDIKNLNYSQRVSTANGLAWAAQYMIKEMTIDEIKFYNIPASINQSEMGNSLLGMSFLAKLQSFTIQQNRLIIVP